MNEKLLSVKNMLVLLAVSFCYGARYSTEKDFPLGLKLEEKGIDIIIFQNKVSESVQIVLSLRIF